MSQPVNIQYMPLQPSKPNTGLIIGLSIIAIVALCLVFDVAGSWTWVKLQIAPSFIGPLVGEFNADNFMTIEVNDKQVYSDKTIGWDKRHKVNIPVQEGDKVTFAVENVGGPGGFIGSFTWNGNRYDVSPGLFTEPKNIMTIGNPSSIWGTAANIQYPNTAAKWIWDANNCGVCTIKFVWMAPKIKK